MVESLAQLMLRECCAYTVSVASKLPEFQTVISRELLKRDDEILTDLKRVLDAVADMRAKATGTEADANFDVAYRRALVQRLDRMQLFGVKIVSGSLRELELSVAYVTLSSTRSNSNGDRDVNSSLSGLTRVVIRGEAGSGKTTLLQWLAVRSASRDFPTSLEEWNSRTPFYVALRHFRDKPFPAPKELVLGAASNIADLMPTGWVQDALTKGALLLLDGLDEVPISRRRELLEWLRTLTEDFPKTTFLLSSRPAALDASILAVPTISHLARLSFEQISLESMSLPDSEALISQWHRAVARDTTDPRELALLETYEKTLIHALHDRPAIRNLASSPLLCGMICVLNWDRKQQLPDNRMELYGLALETLLEKRDSERDIKPAFLVALGKPAKEALLDGVALWMMRNGLAEADESDVVEQIGNLQQRLPEIRNSPNEVMQELLERSGILRQPAAGVVDFVHRTFLEYMAARAAVRGGDLGFLAKQANEESWRETVVFAAGHAQMKQRDQLIEKLLQTPLFSLRSRSIEADVTAACCLETASSDLAPHLVAKLRARAEALFPPKNQNYARILAPAARLSPELLKSHTGEDIVAACIRCASIIGGDQMLEIIESYASVPGDAVWNELILAWSAFEPNEYRARVISKRSERLFGEIAPNNMDDDTIKCLQVLVLKGIHSKAPSKLADALNEFMKERSLTLREERSTSLELVSRTSALMRKKPGASDAANGQITALDAARISEILSLKGLYVDVCGRDALEILSSMPNLERIRFCPENILVPAALSRSSSLSAITLSGLSMWGKFPKREIDLRALTCGFR